MSGGIEVAEIKDHRWPTIFDSALRHSINHCIGGLAGREQQLGNAA